MRFSEGPAPSEPGGGLCGRFRLATPADVPGPGSDGECWWLPAELIEFRCGGGGGLTILVLPPTLTVGLTGPPGPPPCARLIKLSATPSS